MMFHLEGKKVVYTSYTRKTEYLLPETRLNVFLYVWLLRHPCLKQFHAEGILLMCLGSKLVNI